MEACKEATPTVGRGPNQRSSGVGWQESGRRQSRGGSARLWGLLGTTSWFLACATCKPTDKGHRWDRLRQVRSGEPSPLTAPHSERTCYLLLSPERMRGLSAPDTNPLLLCFLRGPTHSPQAKPPRPSNTTRWQRALRPCLLACWGLLEGPPCQAETSECGL